MKTFFFCFLSLFLVRTSSAAPADSALWPFPDTLTLTFKAYGSVSQFHVQYDPRSGQKGPDNYDYASLSWITLPELRIDRLYDEWSFDSTSQTWTYQYDHGYQYNVSNGKIAITIDTQSRTIKNLYFEENFGVTPEDLYHYKISFGGLRYDNHRLIVDDSDFSTNVFAIGYSHDFGMHSYDYGYTKLGSVLRITVGGGINYTLHDLFPPSTPQRPQQIVFDTTTVGRVSLASFNVADTAKRRLVLMGAALLNSDASVYYWTKNATPVILDSGQSVNLIMAFAPKAIGPFTTQLQLATLNPDGSYHMDTIPVTGFAVSPEAVNRTDDPSLEATFWPNPANRYVTIESDNASHLTLRTVLGETVFESAVYPKQRVQLPIMLMAGIYYAEIETARGSVRRTLVIE